MLATNESGFSSARVEQWSRRNNKIQYERLHGKLGIYIRGGISSLLNILKKSGETATSPRAGQPEKGINALGAACLLSQKRNTTRLSLGVGDWGGLNTPTTSTLIVWKTI